MPQPQWYNLKPRERDALLLRIRDSLDSEVRPSLEDAILFEQLVLTYHDDYLTSNAGLRKRSEKKLTLPLSDKDEHQLYIDALEIASSFFAHRKVPSEPLRIDMVIRITAYLNREISAAKLLGLRRETKLPYQLQYFMGAFAHEARNCINRDPHANKEDRNQSKKLSTKNINGSGKELSTKKKKGSTKDHRTNNLFYFLADLSNKHKADDAIIARYKIEENDKPLIALLRDELNKEIEAMPTEQYLHLKFPNTWAQCYYDWRKTEK